MGIEKLKRWHWALIGLILGLILGYSRKMYSEEILDWQLPTPAINSQFEFEDLIRFRDYSNPPLINRIVVHPRKDGRFIVSCWTPLESNIRLMQARAGRLPEEMKSQHVRFYPPQPYVAKDGTKLAPNATILDYLREVDKRDNAKGGLSYSYRWYDIPKYTMLIWTGAAVVIIGGIWPFVLNLLIGAGLGRPAAKEPEYDLSRFKGEPEKKEKPKPTVTDEDMAQVAAMAEQLEKSLAADAAAAAKAAPAGPKTATPVRQLASKPVEAKPVELTPQQKKDFGLTQQDFYPTEVHVKKTKE